MAGGGLRANTINPRLQLEIGRCFDCRITVCPGVSWESRYRSVVRNLPGRGKSCIGWAGVINRIFLDVGARKSIVDQGLARRRIGEVGGKRPVEHFLGKL